MFSKGFIHRVVKGPDCVNMQVKNYIHFYFQGADCENDFDGCASDPCSLGRNCTDRDADEHQADPSLSEFICSDCPIGYEEDDERKCKGKASHSYNQWLPL